jgi:hypothetical protein
VYNRNISDVIPFLLACEVHNTRVRLNAAEEEMENVARQIREQQDGLDRMRRHHTTQRHRASSSSTPTTTPPPASTPAWIVAVVILGSVVRHLVA